MSKMHFRIPAPSLRGRAGGEATKAFLTYEDILP